MDTQGGGSSSVLLTNICPRRVITCFRGSPKKPLDLFHFKFENRSRTTCSRFLKSFAFPDKAVILMETEEGTSHQMVRLVFRPFLQIQRTICPSVSLRASTRVSPDFVPFSERQAHTTHTDQQTGTDTDSHTQTHTDTKKTKIHLLLSDMVLAQLPP